MEYEAPIDLNISLKVIPEWIDYNNHMNVAYYVLAFDKAIDEVYGILGLGPDYRQSYNKSTFALESHVTYAKEVILDDKIKFTAQLIDSNKKCLHFFLCMINENKNYIAATYENISIHVDLQTKKSTYFPESLQKKIDRLMDSHMLLPKPKQAGNIIAIRKTK
tara:strand:- start:245 stop:733 length:489 start_codon:yes stop_codon:yes gene_type:complete